VSSFKITMRDETGAAVQTLEACIRGAGDWSGFWADKSGPISMAWAESRRAMFLSQGRTTGTPWPDYSAKERKYYVPVKAKFAGHAKVTKANLLRWDGTGAEPGSHERLFPSMTVTSHAQYVYRVEGNTATMGTSVPYARNHNLGVGAYLRRWRTKKGIKVIPVPTPRRPLLAFGRPFINAVQNELERVALKSGGKVGITSAELRERAKVARAARGLP
jgi:phage gpG-like protein